MRRDMLRMTNDKEYISLNEFANIANVRVKTIINRYKEIPGIEKNGNEYTVLSGTRYPYDKRRLKKIDNYDEKRYHLLNAIYNYKYISHYELRLHQQQFEDMLLSLERANLIKINGINNPYGANKYDCTELSGKVLSMEKLKAIKEIAEIIADCSGRFVGRVLEECMYN